MCREARWGTPPAVVGAVDPPQTVRLEVLRHVYNHGPLTEGLVRSLHREVSLATLTEDIHEIGYPA